MASTKKKYRNRGNRGNRGNSRKIKNNSRNRITSRKNKKK